MLRLNSVSGALVLALSIAAAGQVSAAPCKDASGKFTKCAASTAKAAPATVAAVKPAVKPVAKPMATAKPATAVKPAAKKS